MIYHIPAYVFQNTSRTCSTETVPQTVQDNITSKLNAALNSFEDNNFPCTAEEGWRRIADFNMSDINQVCPHYVQALSDSVDGLSGKQSIFVRALLSVWQVLHTQKCVEGLEVTK